MKQLIVIRHGETDWNRELRFQGQVDVPINATGRVQAARLAEALTDEHVDALVCSDLLRTRQTAEPVAARLKLDLQPDPGWREQSFGELEGLRVADVERDRPEIWAQWSRHEEDHAVPGGESARHFHGRVMIALQRLAQTPHRRVLVVTHGGVLDMLWRTARDLPLAGPRRCSIPNCGINRFHLEGERLSIMHWADDGHLCGLPEQPSTVPHGIRLASA
ncbi:MAG TPA: histidine phosphatase family protein [Burkholderiaceae bacterium]|nr:histidine phosphatase family protein [Burkholderiaceae bacterium]